jgi:glycosyltransferase involved in cell wall biosynthesis
MSLISSLQKNKSIQDEIVVIYDTDNGTKEVEEYLRSLTVASTEIMWKSVSLNSDFASFKNNFLSLATGDYIVQIDADEIPSNEFFENIHLVLEGMEDCDTFMIVRKNIVVGITDEHIKKWGWCTMIDEGNLLINYPDPQQRIFKNKGIIKWKNKVHEVLENYQHYAILPNEMFLWHKKDIARQEKQNSFYEKI